MITTRSLRSAAVLLALTAGLLAAPGGPSSAGAAGPDTQERADLSGVTLTATASGLDVRYGEVVTIAGRLSSSDPEGPRVGRIQVRLVSVTTFPDGETSIGSARTTRTDEDGDYELRFRPTPGTGYQVWATYPNSSSTADDDQVVKRWPGTFRVSAYLHRVTVESRPGAVLAVDGHIVPQNYAAPGATIELFAGRRGAPLVHRGSYPIANRSWVFALTRTLAPGTWNIRLKYDDGGDGSALRPGYYSGAVVLR